MTIKTEDITITFTFYSDADHVKAYTLTVGFLVPGRAEGVLCSSWPLWCYRPKARLLGLDDSVSHTLDTEPVGWIT